MNSPNLQVNFSEFLSEKTLSPAAIREIHEHVYAIYNNHARTFPWRNTTNPYHIVVSEVILQQTQVNRVIPF